MRKAVFVLTILVIISAGCMGTTKKQEVNSSDAKDEAGSFVKETDWKGVICKQYQEADGYNNVQECVFPKANMQQVYNIVKRIDLNLKSELPLNDLEYPSTKNGCISVSYKYKPAGHLFIELDYQGGVTSIEIVEKGDKTISKITYSVD